MLFALPTLWFYAKSATRERLLRIEPISAHLSALEPFANSVIESPNGSAVRKSAPHTQVQRVFILVTRVLLGTFYGAVSKKHLPA